MRGADGTGRDWYDDYVPGADQVVDSYQKGVLQ